MEKIIKIGEKEVKISNNVAWTMEYRDQFNEDILPQLVPFIQSIGEALAPVLAKGGNVTSKSVGQALQEQIVDIVSPLYFLEFDKLIVNVLWAMAKAADERIDPPKKWVRQFDVFPVDEIAPEVLRTAASGFVSAKNLQRLSRIAEQIRRAQPLTSTPSSSQESKED